MMKTVLRVSLLGLALVSATASVLAQIPPFRTKELLNMQSTPSQISTRNRANTGPSLDFVAPGVDIYTASFDDPFSMNAFHMGPGTSFSTPMVTGIASLGFSIRPAMTKDELIFALKTSVVDLGTPGWDPQHGWGRVNANDALVTLRDWIFSDGFETGDVSKWTSSSP